MITGLHRPIISDVGYSEQKLHEAEPLIQEIVARLDPEKVLLFGSVARMAAREGSDVDLLIVKSSDRPFKDRMRTLYTDIERTIDVDMVWYTPQELAEMERSSSFVRAATRDAKVIYERET